MTEQAQPPRTKLFISKATPGDDAFALWLAPRLEAEGYEVFADILDLDTGDGWRRKITHNLQNCSIKMLLCCSDETLARDGVIEEIEIAKDLTRSLQDPNFILPLKMKAFKKLFGIGSLQYIDFETSWAVGLTKLLKSLERQNVPKLRTPKIQPEWAAYQRRQAVKLLNEPEVLTSNWLRILSVPDEIHFIRPKGATNKTAMKSLAKSFQFPFVPFEGGFLTFAAPPDFEDHFSSMGAFDRVDSISYTEFAELGWEARDIEQYVSSRIIVNLLRQAWEQYCTDQGFGDHEFANGKAHFVTKAQIGLNKRVSWGRQGQRRQSVLRNIARKKVWEYGVSTQPSLFPFPHYRLKGRVVFSEIKDLEKGNLIDDHRVQHRLRRSVCGSWRNKAWHGRLMAFVELLSGDSPNVTIPVGIGAHIVIDAMPIQVTSPVTARNADKLGEDAVELDASTLGGYFGENES